MAVFEPVPHSQQFSPTVEGVAERPRYGGIVEKRPMLDSGRRGRLSPFLLSFEPCGAAVTTTRIRARMPSHRSSHVLGGADSKREVGPVGCPVLVAALRQSVLRDRFRLNNGGLYPMRDNEWRPKSSTSKMHRFTFPTLTEH